MSHIRVAAMSAAFGAFGAMLMLGAALPDIGIHMFNSRDLDYVKSGCALKYDVEGKVFRCADRVAVDMVSVSLSSGTNTVVPRETVSEDSVVVCGCWPCNERGSWAARVNAIEVYNGGFKLRHGYALGSEALTCVVL